jgi:hypothetical protein
MVDCSGFRKGDGISLHIRNSVGKVAVDGDVIYGCGDGQSAVAGLRGKGEREEKHGSISQPAAWATC